MSEFELFLSELTSPVNFAMTSFVISILLAIAFFLSNVIRNFQHQRMVKKIIENNILQLTKIYNRLYADVGEINGISESDQQRVSEITLYFERKHTRIEMIRMNVENQLAHITKINSYYRSVNEILDDLDIIMEKCYNPKLPLKYQLSTWQDNRDIIQSTTRNTITVAREKLNIT